MTLELRKVHHGDMLDLFKRDVPDECFDMVLMDPPYGVAFKSNMAAEGFEKDPIENDGWEDWLDKHPRWVRAAYRALKPGGAFAMFVAGGCRVPAMPHAWLTCHDIFKEIHTVVCWDRLDMGMGWKFRPQWEGIIVAFKGGVPKTWNGTGKEANVLRHARIIPKAGEHPTPKPLPLLGQLITLMTNEGDVVADPFCGGGSVPEACELLKRKWWASDMMEKYVTMAQARVDRFKTEPLMF